MFEFPIFKAFINHDLILGLPRKVFMFIWIIGGYAVLASGALYFLVVCLVLHYACYIVTKYVDVNFVEIFVQYFTSEDRRS